jgi:hypothetical protein
MSSCRSFASRLLKLEPTLPRKMTKTLLLIILTLMTVKMPPCLGILMIMMTRIMMNLTLDLRMEQKAMQRILDLVTFETCRGVVVTKIGMHISLLT